MSAEIQQDAHRGHGKHVAERRIDQQNNAQRIADLQLL